MRVTQLVATLLIIFLSTGLHSKDSLDDLEFQREDVCYEAIQIALALSGRPLLREKDERIPPASMIGNFGYSDVVAVLKNSGIRFEYRTSCPVEQTLKKLNSEYTGVIVEASKPNKVAEIAATTQAQTDSKFFILNFSQGEPRLHEYPKLNQRIDLARAIEFLRLASVRSLIFFSPEGLLGNADAATAVSGAVQVVGLHGDKSKIPVGNQNASGVTKGESINFPKEISLGRIARTAKVVVATFSLKNTGTSPLSITRVQGTCSCFLRSECPKTISPGSDATISLYFSPELFKFSDRFKTAVAFELDDKQLKRTSVGVSGDFTDEGYCFLSFETIDLGAITRAQLQKQAVRCALFTLKQAQGFQIVKTFSEPRGAQITEISDDNAQQSALDPSLSSIRSFKVTPPEGLPTGTQHLTLVIETNDPIYQQASASLKFTLID